jgi:hypothetical protein
MLRFLLVLADGTPHDPACLVTPIPNWSVDEKITLGHGAQVRIVAINTILHTALAQRGFNAIFTVEPI